MLDAEKDKSTVVERGLVEDRVYILKRTLPVGDEITLLDLARALWDGRWIIVGITLLIVVLSLLYAFTATEWYRAQVLLAPTNASSTNGIASQLGRLSGLAGLAGLNLSDQTEVEPVAVLKSRTFARAFIEDRNLLPVLFPDKWDKATGTWLTSDSSGHPDIRDGVNYFIGRIREVSVDPDTQLVTLSVEWKDPELAADWANDLAIRLNEYMRQRALEEAETHVSFLRSELKKTNVAMLRQSISNLLGTELQQLMLARGNSEFAFRVIDRAEIPKHRESPKRLLILVLGGLLGVTVSLLFVFIRSVVLKRRRFLM